MPATRIAASTSAEQLPLLVLLLLLLLLMPLLLHLLLGRGNGIAITWQKHGNDMALQ